MLKIKSLTEDQMFAAALAYETSRCDIPMEEFLQNVLVRYEEIHTIQKKFLPRRTHLILRIFCIFSCILHLFHSFPACLISTGRPSPADSGSAPLFRLILFQSLHDISR